MKYLYKSIPIILLFIISSCESVDECTADDWVGTYTAEISCNLSGMLGDLEVDTSIMLPLETMTIIKIDDQTIVFDDGGVENPEIKVGGCEIQIDTSLSSNNAMAFAEITYVLDGNKITGTGEIDASALTEIADADLDFTCQVFFQRIN